MNVKQREAISTAATVAIIVVIIVIAGVAAYFVLVPGSTSSTTTTTSSVQTTTTSSVATTTTTTSSLYGPTNSSLLVDESQGAAYDSLDPQYAFYLQDTAMLNAVYQNLIELNGSSGNVFQPVLADSYNVNLNGGATNSFNIRPNVWFSNGDNFSSYDVWFTIVRNLYMNAPSFIAGFNWNQIIYNLTAGGSEYSDSYCWNNAGLGLPAGLADAIASVTGKAANLETVASCNLASSIVGQMLSNFNPSNSTQAAIMAYANQAVVAPNSTTFVANYFKPLGTFGLELWSGFDGQNVVDPAFVDAHGGVVNNTLNSYINLNGAIGTGPYMIKSVGAGLAPVTFVATPHYWGAYSAAITGNASMTDAAPAKINTIIYNVAPSDTALIQDFATNKAQLSTESIQEYGQMYNAFHANQPSFAFNQIHKSEGAFPFGSWFLMNTVTTPTNITAFRLGWESAINYTELNLPNYYNGQAYGTYFIGALTPAFGSYYNPANYSPASYNTTAAFNYFQAAGMQGNFYTVVPAAFTLSNGTSIAAGTVIGNPNGQQLAPLKLYYTVPLLTELKGQLQGIEANLGLFGIGAVPYGITSAESNILTSNAQTFPQVEILGWGPDYADPFLAMYEPLLLPSPYNGWFTNSTVEAEVAACDFAVGAQVNACALTLEQMTIQNGLFPPFPNIPTYYFFIQPYVQGFVNNPYVGYWYNQIYYQPVQT
ncbi:MAG: hypothetical protein JRM73_00650 [Nitrososphaerota archaeon]|nr:hypothetical protein [Nitrososphaerota archaeon]